MNYTENIRIRLDKDLKKLIKQRAKREKKTISALVREWILGYEGKAKR